MTRTEYEQLVEQLAAAERERLAESLNAVFEQNGHSRETLLQVLTMAVETQPAVTARIVTGVLDQLGLLPADPEAPDAAP
ncbi:MAG: hypothetical protein HFF34_10825 [Oscillospiraceae bacterium]|nr:hypothetical protein [Oscillospiraceae bacterium]MCI9581842.1 hypothetical protein [Oscillospiraceae bacterium]